MREVDAKAFHEKIGPLNVVGRIVNAAWPYTMEFYLQSSYDQRRAVGKIVGELSGVIEVKRYFLE